MDSPSLDARKIDTAQVHAMHCLLRSITKEQLRPPRYGKLDCHPGADPEIARPARRTNPTDLT
jgi:hypothetical protein